MSYIGRTGKLSQRAYNKVSFLATAGQTIKTGLSYVAGFVEVYLNGVLLTDTVDYTATNGNSVTFVLALNLDDEITIVSLKTFVAANMLSLSGGTITGDLGVVGTVTVDGNFGIGTNSPSGAAGTTLAINGGANQARLALKNTSSGDASGDGLQLVFENNSGRIEMRENLPLVFTTNNVERMRIDSAGNLLVGKTAVNLATQGAEIRSDGVIIGTKAGNILELNRLTSDGDLAHFRKDGAIVGSIGTVSSDLTIGTGNAGLRFNNPYGELLPHNVSTNSGTDATVTLGSGAVRFKDLYLSGGVYLGGTGAANTLDDYEEGTWTPVLNFGGGVVGIVYTNQLAKYTKIGNRVYFDVFISLSSAGTSTGSGTISLPFAASNDWSTTGHESCCSIGFATGLNNIVRSGIFLGNIVFFDQNTTQSSGENEDEFNDNCNFRVSGNYKTA